MENFIGKDGFNWWIGVIENRIDPLQMGRCQVRIFGHHTENKQLIPTEDLPWAACLSSPNASNSFSTPKEGDYVMGFFSDSSSSQAPVIIGIYPGIKQNAGGDKGFQDPRTAEEIAAAPQVPDGQVQEEAGKPTTAPLARGVVTNTALEKAANEREHVCDICNEVNKDVAELKSQVSGLITQARVAIESAYAATTSTPAAEQAKQTIKEANDKVKAIKKELQPIADEIRVLQEYAAYLVGLINTINSLPSQMQALLAKCLSDATSSLTLTNTNLGSLQNQTNVLNSNAAALVEAQAVAQGVIDSSSVDISTIKPQLG